ncbi:trimethylguanosine synthase-like isoform X4 [Tubulinosema ratisbonensis]|uniref:Trimethylguanosine synthase n=1 Tax=Tubulinosema ratisbonensis TaxID=291195 RepID=A0A437AJM1_9MICR|nr:trimethylguanosine synthase-like isoform X4 [Tubulinosema ratisbonensis]
MSNSKEIIKKKNGWLIQSRTLIYNPKLVKFHPNTRKLTSLLKHGFMLDEEDWYSITPECIVNNIIKNVERNKIDKLCTEKEVLCAFSGVGGDVIPFLKRGYNITAVDFSYKIKYLKENVAVLKSITKITGNLTPITCDFFEFIPNKTFFLSIISPPWGGLSYKNNKEILKDMRIEEIHNKIIQFSKNIIYFLPKNIKENEIKEIFSDFLIKPAKDDRGKIIGILVYYGDLFI